MHTFLGGMQSRYGKFIVGEDGKFIVGGENCTHYLVVSYLMPSIAAWCGWLGSLLFEKQLVWCTGIPYDIMSYGEQL